MTTVDPLGCLHPSGVPRIDEPDAVKRAGAALWQRILLFPAFAGVTLQRVQFLHAVASRRSRSPCHARPASAAVCFCFIGTTQQLSSCLIVSNSNSFVIPCRRPPSDRGNGSGGTGDGIEELDALQGDPCKRRKEQNPLPESGAREGDDADSREDPQSSPQHRKGGGQGGQKNSLGMFLMCAHSGEGG